MHTSITDLQPSDFHLTHHYIPSSKPAESDLKTSIRKLGSTVHNLKDVSLDVPESGKSVNSSSYSPQVHKTSNIFEDLILD